jgi:membrane protein required for colicin V production
MTAFDYSVIAVLLLSAALGIWRGFVYEIFALGAWILGVVCATIFGPRVATWIHFRVDEWLKVIVAYAIVFVAVFVLMGIVGFILTKMIRAVGLSPVDRGLGAMFGFVRGVFIVMVVVFLASFTNLRESDWWKQSASAKPFEVMASLLRQRLPESVTKHFRSSARLVPSPLRAEGAPLGAGEGDVTIRIGDMFGTYPLSRRFATPSPTRGEGNTSRGSLCAA